VIPNEAHESLGTEAHVANSYYDNIRNEAGEWQTADNQDSDIRTTTTTMRMAATRCGLRGGSGAT
jgi:hypothetical protein